MSEISKININGTAYDIKDVTARKAAADALAQHDNLLNKTDTTQQNIDGQVKFNQGILLEMGASVSDNGQTVTFR